MFTNHTIVSCNGPSICRQCKGWPARATRWGTLCHICECVEICRDNPVPLPNNKDMLLDLAAIGVEGAFEKLIDTK